MKIDGFKDDSGFELRYFINDNNKLFMEISEPGEDIIYCGFICLEKEDVTELIKSLKVLVKQM